MRLLESRWGCPVLHINAKWANINSHIHLALYIVPRHSEVMQLKGKWAHPLFVDQATTFATTDSADQVRTGQKVLLRPNFFHVFRC